MRYMVFFLAMVLLAGCGGTVAYARPNRHHSWRQHHIRQYRPMRQHRYRRPHYRSHHYRARYYIPTVYTQESVAVIPQYQDVPDEAAGGYSEGLGDDREFFYGDVVARTPQAMSAPTPQPELAAVETGRRDKADAAYERATDALRILRRLQEKQKKGESR